MPEGDITFQVPPGLTKDAITSQLDTAYDNPVASRILEAARAQLTETQEFEFNLHIKW